MKKSHLITIILLLFVFQQCSHDDAPVTEKTKVTFSLSSSTLASGRTKSYSLDDVTTVVANLQSGGTMISQRISLTKFGDTYATNPVELAPGTYTLTDFFLENDSSNVLFATPHSGSSLAPLVKHPLSINFNVVSGKNTTVAMEVVPVDNHSPEDFGYATFSVQVARPLSVSVFTTEGTPKLASAKAYILHAADTVAKYSLGAKVNLISFKLDPEQIYQLVIIKDGFTKYTKTFIYDSLTAELNGLALKAYLAPALSFNSSVTWRNYRIDGLALTLYSTNDTPMHIEWGDGTSEDITINADEYGTYIHHDYPNATVTYYTTISGDVNKIKEVDGSGGEVIIRNMNFEHVPELTGINFFQTGTDVLDLHKNTKMEYIVFGGSKLILPEHNKLKIVVIWGTALASSLDQIINNVYQNAVAGNISDGQFLYSLSPDSNEEIPLGTPSDESILKLQELAYNRGWIVTPNP
ncbi:MAG TPA: hypothetical protein VIM65_03420 [Cyclobacteriaceae bacterium]